MAAAMMRRYTTEETVALQTDATSPEIDISHAASGEISIPHSATYVTLTYYIAAPSGTLYAAQDTSGSAVTQTVAADKSYPMPSVLFGAGKIQIRANAAGNIIVNLKS